MVKGQIQQYPKYIIQNLIILLKFLEQAFIKFCIGSVVFVSIKINIRGVMIFTKV